MVKRRCGQHWVRTADVFKISIKNNWLLHFFAGAGAPALFNFAYWRAQQS
jgi:hypothetical protein